jgi:hypothetical protein
MKRKNGVRFINLFLFELAVRSYLVLVVAETLFQQVGALVGVVQRRLQRATLFQEICRLTFQLVALVTHEVELQKK